MKGRIDRLRAGLEEPFLVTNPTNVRYLSGFESSNAALLVEQERTRLFTDFRYGSAARAVEGVEFEETGRALLNDLANRLSGPIGFEADFVTYDGVKSLSANGVDTVPRRGLVERLRAVKDDTELEALRRACEITDRVYERLADEPFVGRSERAVAWAMALFYHEEGAETISVEIVASGPNGARPHARATERTIGAGETVVVDTGCTVGGYASDCTRTFATGPLDDELEEAYETCLRAQLAGLEAIRAGVNGVEADAAARAIVEESRFAGAFGHGLGHGLGLEIHEAPRLSPESSDLLEAGNVTTVEPGIYLEGRGGIRIEDDVVVTADGIENLTTYRKDLVTVD